MCSAEFYRLQQFVFFLQTAPFFMTIWSVRIFLFRTDGCCERVFKPSLPVCSSNTTSATVGIKLSASGTPAPAVSSSIVLLIWSNFSHRKPRSITLHSHLITRDTVRLIWCCSSHSGLQLGGGRGLVLLSGFVPLNVLQMYHQVAAPFHLSERLMQPDHMFFWCRAARALKSRENK